MTTSLFPLELTPNAPPAEHTLQTLQGLPSLRSLYLSALLKRRAGLSRGARFPSVGVEAPLLLESGWLRRYLAICGWRTEEPLTTPLTVGQVCAAPVQSVLLMGDHNPLSPLGLVHASNEILAHQALPLETPLWVRVWFGETEWRPRGVMIDVHTVISSQARPEEPLWLGRTRAFKATQPDREAIKAQRAEPRERPAPLSSAEGARAPLTLQLPPDMGRRYAPIAQDRNPIHLYPWTARLFGFKRPIMHGMWTLGRALAEGCPTPREASVGSLEVHFKRPVELPSSPALTLCPSEGGEALTEARFELRTEADKLAIEGAWRLA